MLPSLKIKVAGAETFPKLEFPLLIYLPPGRLVRNFSLSYGG